ncbi:MAG TPA: ChuX/HutX family heme-like substrate-binding protein [Ohtaekwangia sp.]
MSTVLESKITSLREAWRGIQQAKPGIRIREAARELGSSEAALLATKIGEGVVRLQVSWPDLLQRFKTLGRVMSLTRNDTCILEHKGPFQEIDIMGEGTRAMATVIGPIETRVFFQAWHVAFAVTEEKSDRVLKSIQVFDKSGEAITKIYLQEKSNEEAYHKIVEDFRAPDQSSEINTEPYAKEELTGPVNKEEFLKDWSELKDTHDFFGMLRAHKVHRYHALEIASGKFSYQVDAALSPKQILDEASLTKLPIMIFAGNRGNLQIHQGKVRTIRVLSQGHGGAQNWLNVLDPDFNMHLRMDFVHTAWVVKKPTSDGHVTSVELFDKEKNLIAQFFGLRKPGIPEKEDWRALVSKLPAL